MARYRAFAAAAIRTSDALSVVDTMPHSRVVDRVDPAECIM
jgi:hypothetical protein